MEDAVISPVTDYVFGAFCLILLSTLIIFIKIWRVDNKETTKAMLDNSIKSTEALINNTTASEKLTDGISGMTKSFQRLHEELISRPCFVEDEDKG